MEDLLWKMVGFGFRKKAIAGVAFTVRTPDGREKVITKEGSPLALVGEPGEIVLYLSGRKSAAVVTLDGPDDAIAIVTNAKFGVGARHGELAATACRAST